MDALKGIGHACGHNLIAIAGQHLFRHFTRAIIQLRHCGFLSPDQVLLSLSR